MSDIKLLGTWEIKFKDGTIIQCCGNLDTENFRLNCIYESKNGNFFVSEEKSYYQEFYTTGILYNNFQCTLNDCYIGKRIPIEKNKFSFIIDFNSCIIGQRLEKTTEQKFTQAQIYFSGLENMIFNPASLQEAIPQHGLRLSISPAEELTSLGMPLTHKKYIVLDFDEPKTLQQINKLVYTIRCFFVIIFTSPINVEDLYVISTYGLSGQYTAPFRHLVIQNLYPKEKHSFKNTSLLSSIKNPFLTWFNTFEAFEFQISTIFDNLTHSLTSETALMSCIHAIEGFHRIKEKDGVFSGNYMQESAYAPIFTILTDAIPKNTLSNDHKTSLTNRLKYGYQKALRSRVKELINYVGEKLCSLFVISPSGCKKDFFTNKIIDLRNHYAHLDVNEKDKVKDITEDHIKLYNYKTSIFWFLYILIMLEIFPQNAILKEMANKNLNFTEDFRKYIKFKDPREEYADKVIQDAIDKIKKDISDNS